MKVLTRLAASSPGRVGVCCWARCCFGFCLAATSSCCCIRLASSCMYITLYIIMIVNGIIMHMHNPDKFLAIVWDFQLQTQNFDYGRSRYNYV